jgi:tetratricopeptide (TPR) repeat protein
MRGEDAGSSRRDFLKYSGLLVAAASCGLEGCMNAQQRAFASAREDCVAGRFDQAIGTLEQELRENPDAPSDAYALLGSAHARKGQWSQAEDAFTRAIYRDDKSAFAYRGRGAVHFRRGEAKQAMQSAFPYKPELGDEALKRFALAVGDLERAILIDPSSPQAYAFLGFATYASVQYARTDQEREVIGERAYSALRRAVELLNAQPAAGKEPQDADPFWARKARTLYDELKAAYRKEL